ncbi:MAG: glutathione S-transferase family protein [Hyphomonadaceae bacterium]|nr:glutathione S-transferase family protein [Hyphomonadaceae bacterium]
MSLTLYYHPLSSFCWKALIALYETGVAFTPKLVNLGDAKDRADFLALWPVGKFPVLKDEARDWIVPESSIIIEYLAQHHPGKTALIPADPDLARQMRMRDRFFDLYIHERMQKMVSEYIRPEGSRDPYGAEQARAGMETAYDLVERDMASKTWVMGEAFTMADCAAAPALHYGRKVVPFGEKRPNLARYLERLEARPSFARVLEEAKPYAHMFPVK